MHRKTSFNGAWPAYGLHEAVVFVGFNAADGQFTLDRAHGFQRNTHSNQDGRSREREVGDPRGQQRRNHSQHREEERRKQVEAVRGTGEVIADVLAALSGDGRTLLHELLRLLIRIKADGRIEEGEADNQERGEDHIHPRAAAQVGIAPSGEAAVRRNQRANRSGERQQAVREDQGQNADGHNLQGHVGVLTAVNAATLDLLGNLQRDTAFAKVNVGHGEGHDNQHQQDNKDRQPSGRRAICHRGVDVASDAVEQVGDDTGEDQQADAVADALVGNALANPHRQRRAASHAQTNQHRVVPAGADIAPRAGQTDCLEDSQTNRHITGDARHLLLAAFFFLHPLQGREGNRQQLHDNAGIDVGGDAHCHNGHLTKGVTGHHLHHVQQGQLHEVVAFIQTGDVNARSRDDANQSINEEHEERVQNFLLEVFDLPQLAKCLKHVRSPRQCRQRPQSSPSRKRCTLQPSPSASWSVRRCPEPSGRPEPCG